MSKWFMQGHFRHLHFNSSPMTWRSPQGEVFWPLQSSSEVLGVSKDSQVPISKMWVSSSHSSKSGVATINLSTYSRNLIREHLVNIPLLTTHNTTHEVWSFDLWNGSKHLYHQGTPLVVIIFYITFYL
jgi:hypothetical protein